MILDVHTTFTAHAIPCGPILAQIPRTEWVLKWPGQVVIAGCQTMWTTEVSQALEEGRLPALYQDLLKQVCVNHCS